MGQGLQPGVRPLGRKGEDGRFEEVIDRAACFNTVPQIAVEFGLPEEEITAFLDGHKQLISAARKRIVKALPIQDQAYRLMVLNEIARAGRPGERLSAIKTARVELLGIMVDDDDWLQASLEKDNA